MKTYYLVGLCSILLFASCKTEPKKETEQPEPEKSVPELIAEAHGFQNWKSVKEISFTFNVDRDTMHFERSWDWKPKTNDVIFTTTSDTLVYNRNAMDSVALKTNAGFINDRYWLLAPFNLMWDANNYAFEHTADSQGPISGEPMQKLTIVYGNDGGYTPGDAYDFYFTDDHLIREWVYRKSNQEEPSLMATWEDYVNMGGLQLAQKYNRPNSDVSLYFTGLSVKTD